MWTRVSRNSHKKLLFSNSIETKREKKKKATKAKPHLEDMISINWSLIWSLNSVLNSEI